MTIPPYLNCDSVEINHCDFYFHKDCPESCGFARDIKADGVGAICDTDLVRKIREVNYEN